MCTTAFSSAIVQVFGFHCYSNIEDCSHLMKVFEPKHGNIMQGSWFQCGDFFPQMWCCGFANISIFCYRWNVCYAYALFIITCYETDFYYGWEHEVKKEISSLTFFIIEFKFTIKLNPAMELHKWIYICSRSTHSVLHTNFFTNFDRIRICIAWGLTQG